MRPASLASTPPMGWNSWNTFRTNINETVVRETADALVSSGLKDFGYEYIVIDDCWSIKDKRDGNGDLITDSEKFPNGIKASDIGLLDTPWHWPPGQVCICMIRLASHAGERRQLKNLCLE